MTHFIIIFRMALTLVILSIFTSTCVRRHKPEFLYNQRVHIIDGFYKGYSGTVIDFYQYSEDYVVNIDNLRISERVHEGLLEAE